MESIQLFCCYARKDRNYLLQLKTHLAALQREYRLLVWDDYDISPGSLWEQEIQNHLNSAHIILLLISPHFVASEYCFSKEMRQAIERHEQGRAHVIPVILRPTHWQIAPLNTLQALPRDAKAVTSWKIRDEAFLNILNGIRKVIEEQARQRGRSWLAPNQPILDLHRAAPSPDVPLRQIFSGTPDARTLETIYTQVTKEQPIWHDPLDGIGGSPTWEQVFTHPGGGIDVKFEHDGCHVISRQENCLVGITHAQTLFSNFICQARMCLLKGSGGGLLFRAHEGHGHAYGYRFCLLRNYFDLIYAATLITSSPDSLKAELGKISLLAVMIYNYHISLYVG